jgi:cell division protein FtsZ
MVLPGLINLDFADVRTVMTEMGKAMMGTGEASGEDRALVAAQNAIANPLLDEISLKGARAVLVNVTGGDDMTLLEVDEAANAISEQVDPEANIIFGAAPDPSLNGKIRVSVVATGMDGQAIAAIEPKPQRAAQPALSPMTMREPAVEREPMTPAAAVAASSTVGTIEPEPAQPEPVFAPAYSVTVEQPIVHEPAAPLLELQGELYEAPKIETAEPQTPAPAPLAAEAAPEETEDEPLFGARPLVEEPRPAKAGFLGLFGPRTRSDPPPLRDYRNDPTPVLQARAAAGGGAAAVAQPLEEEHEEAGEDLEIPSFLRRLAN